MPVYDKTGKATEVVHIDEVKFELTNGAKKTFDVRAKAVVR